MGDAKGAVDTARNAEEADTRAEDLADIAATIVEAE